jgi:hypothetical protein
MSQIAISSSGGAVDGKTVSYAIKTIIILGTSVLL